MTRPHILPEMEHNPDRHTDSTERHPAYAQIAASRVSGAALLYGSDFRHQHFITLRINTSELHRSLNKDWYSEDGTPMIEVAMSEVQWASFISTLNMGSGTPCTLQFVNGSGPVPGIAAKTQTRGDQFKGELADQLNKARKEIAAAQALLQTGAGTAGQRKKALDHLHQASMAVECNAEFVAKSFGEHIERWTERAKTEIHGYLSGIIQRTGIKALRGESPIQLEGEKEK
jgi:hypothetical protein